MAAILAMMLLLSEPPKQPALVQITIIEQQPDCATTVEFVPGDDWPFIRELILQKGR